MERNNEQKLELFADLLEPMSKILSDKEVTEPISQGVPWVTVIKTAIKNHAHEFIEIMANIEGVPIDEYEVNLITLPVKLLNFVNRPEVQELFISQGQKKGNESSGSATGHTQDGAK